MAGCRRSASRRLAVLFALDGEACSPFGMRRCRAGCAARVEQHLDVEQLDVDVMIGSAAASSACVGGRSRELPVGQPPPRPA